MEQNQEHDQSQIINVVTKDTEILVYGLGRESTQDHPQICGSQNNSMDRGTHPICPVF